MYDTSLNIQCLQHLSFVGLFTHKYQCRLHERPFLLEYVFNIFFFFQGMEMAWLLFL